MSQTKGQFSIEFYFSLIVFVFLVLYLFFQMFSLTPAYTRAVNEQRSRSEAYQLSEILVNDAGLPTDWQDLIGTAREPEIKRLGFSAPAQNRTNFLAAEKFVPFNDLCNQFYDKAKSWLGLTSDNFLVSLTDVPNSQVLINCLPSVPPKAEKARVERLVAFDSGSYGLLVLEVWS